MILSARVYDVCSETPLTFAQNLSALTHNRVYFKREDMQPVFSFKCRGSYNRMVQMSDDEKARGVLACSAGNHAQGVALAAKRLGIKATIFMPLITPEIKWKAVKLLGAEVRLEGPDFDAAKAACQRMAEETGRLVIHPFDDPFVIAGNGTIGVEIMKQAPDTVVDAIFVAVGGGGISAGICAYVKRIFPQVKVIGVETVDACAMTHSLEAGHRVEEPSVGLFADGAAVRLVGEETFRVCQRLMDGTVLVTNDELCAAIQDAFTDTRVILEPSGALGIAGAKKYVETHQWRDKVVVAVTSGANMNFSRLRFVAERADFGEGREALYYVSTPERPGAFNNLYSAVSQYNVTKFSYRYNDPDRAAIFLGLTIPDVAERKKVVAKLAEGDMEAIDITDNELTKTHLQHTAGGRSSLTPHERLLRFTFPEKPGALKYFLRCLKSQFNCTMFHYRNIGGDVASVLVGLEISPDQGPLYDQFLADLGFPCVDETDNVVYRRFLR
eukprot:TRINITY_DN8425_c0_g1_i1.p1 TRINITY_DN8425_c0_g1~~TRINITY_DN8425_c0_g1_i1.p1  ORF type:complete len:498 (-),score=198.27 TRINITY_DN8425_c0_g1_i1:97-1590(-)